MLAFGSPLEIPVAVARTSQSPFPLYVTLKNASPKNGLTKKNIKMKGFLFSLLLITFSINCYCQNEVEQTYKFIKKQGENPEKYVISKFKKYDYVFIGEYHRNKQDVDFVAGLIPKLYKNGVKNIAYEFYEYANQSKIDSLLTAKEWNDEKINHTLSKGFGVCWGYTEYINLLKKVWVFNKTLKDNQPKFRVVMMQYEYFPCKKGLEMFGGVDPDKFMADVVEKEIVSKGEKALIYCGIHHAFTIYQQPQYDFETKKFYGLSNKRLGNILHAKYLEKTFTIFMHSPWMSNISEEEQSVRPANGTIDSALEILKYKPVGFDVKNTFAGTLKSTDSYYSIGHKDFKLSDFCDGYIFLKPYKTVKFVSVDKNFYDEYNIKLLKQHFKCRGWSDEQINSIDNKKAIEILTEDPKEHFGKLAK